jgi:hypothetical protein
LKFQCREPTIPKSGAVVKEPTPDGPYHTYWSDSFFYHAASPDLPDEQYFTCPVNPWENRLIEPGPAPIKTRDGRRLLVYNGMTAGRVGFAQNQYSVSQMLIDPGGSFRPSLNKSQTVGYAGSMYQPALKGIETMANPAPYDVHM